MGGVGSCGLDKVFGSLRLLLRCTCHSEQTFSKVNLEPLLGISAHEDVQDEEEGEGQTTEMSNQVN